MISIKSILTKLHYMETEMLLNLGISLKNTLKKVTIREFYTK